MTFILTLVPSILRLKKVFELFILSPFLQSRSQYFSQDVFFSFSQVGTGCPRVVVNCQGVDIRGVSTVPVRQDPLESGVFGDGNPWDPHLTPLNFSGPQKHELSPQPFYVEIVLTIKMGS